MDTQSYARVLSYAVCELAMPVKRHVYTFASNYQSSLNHHLLSAAAKVAKRAKNKLKIKKEFGLQHPKLKLKHSKNNINVNGNPNKHSSLSNLSECGVILKQNGNHTTKENIKQEILINMDTEKQVSKPSKFHSEVFADFQTNSSVSERLEGQDEVESEKIINSGSSELCTTDEIHAINSTETEQEKCEQTDEMTGFYSDPLLLCSDNDFMIMFRMNRTSFKNVLAFVAKDELEPIENIPLYKKVLIVLWLMGTSASYSDAAQVFSVTEEAAANCFFDICATLYNRSDSIIKWPGSEEGAEIAARVEEQFGFPGVVGVLGCRYFSIAIPKDAFSRKDHFNAKLRTYSISLQIVCDDRLIIRDIFPGLPGGKPEPVVLRESPLCEQLMSNDPSQRLVDAQKHILARREYPQLSSMLTPYIEQKRSLSKEEEDFNNLHESVCQLVDQTFQMLEARFPTLKLLDPEVATMVLVSSCVIHNICMENDDVFEIET